MGVGSLVSASAAPYDLWFDPNTVDSDLVVECWISHGPRADDPSIDPQVGDRIVSRDGNRVWIRVELPADLIGTSQQPSRATG